MAYREDPDLLFLSRLRSGKSLDNLVSILTLGNDGTPRLTENLTSSTLYKNHYPEHTRYWQLIAEEIQRYGANTVASMLRLGKGVLYREILIDVAKHLKVKVNKKNTTADIEQELILGLFEKQIDKMSLKERARLGEQLGFSNSVNGYTKDYTKKAFQEILKYSGIKKQVMDYMLRKFLGRGVMKAGVAASKSVGMKELSTAVGTTLVKATPPGWAITGALLVLDIASPAMRVTVPVVFEIIRLRELYEN